MQEDDPCAPPKDGVFDSREIQAIVRLAGSLNRERLLTVLQEVRMSHEGLRGQLQGANILLAAR